MRKRLRKKMHRREYQEFGFLAMWEFDDAQTEQTLASFADELIDTVEAHQMTFGGAIAWKVGSGFFCRRGRGSVPTSDRDAIESWLRVWPGVNNTVVGPLEDAWYSANSQYNHILDWLNDKFGIGRPLRIITPPPKP